MKGPGGLPSREIGQRAAKAIGNTTKQQFNTWGQAVKQQVTGNYQQKPEPFSPKSPDVTQDITNLLETNQSQQKPAANPVQQPPSQPVNMEEKYAQQHKEDQAKLEAARKNIKELEEKMEVIEEKREKEYEKRLKEEEQKEEQQELLHKEEEKQNPIATLLKIRKHEGGKASG